MSDQLLTPLLHKQFKQRVFEESFARLNTCLHLLSEEQIWHQSNDNSNSVGNLVLHICGNLRQWILNGLYHQIDVRQRSDEFKLPKAEDVYTKSHLKQTIQILENDLKHALKHGLPDNLHDIRPIQVFEETGVSILIHAIEHCSYHTGQIALLTKLMIDEDLGFYRELNL